jgi:hypothetical protein
MRSRMQELGVALTVVALLALITAACARGGDDDDGGVATVNGGATATTAGGDGEAKDPQEAALEFARCMRENGVEDFPDPKVGEDGLIEIGPGPGRKREDPDFRKASDTCRDKLEAGGVGPSRADPEMQASMLEFSKCMRENGVENFPDPTFDDGRATLGFGKESGIDPNSPTFKAAEKVCQPKLRLPKRGGASQ